MKLFNNNLKKLLSLALVASMLSGFMPVGFVAAAGETVTSFVLVDPITDEDVKTINENEVINLAYLSSKNLNVRANTNPVVVEKVSFNLDNGAHTRNETTSPYALFGDTSGNYYATNTLALGRHTLKATPYVAGISGITATVNFTVVNDGEAPIISGVSSNGYYNSDVAITVTDKLDPTPEVTLNGLRIESGKIVTQEGTYTVCAKDAAGNVSAPVTFSIDKTAPVITLKGENPFAIERGEAFVDPGYVVTDQSPYTTTVENTVNAGVSGNYSVTYGATDVAGNPAVVVVRTVKVQDTKGPVVDAGQDVVTSKAFAHVGVAIDPFGVETVTWQKEAGPKLGTVNFSYPEEADYLHPTISATVDGVYIISLTATDKEGNKNTDTFTLIWDTTAPEKVDAGKDTSFNKEAVLTGVAADATSGIATVLWEVISQPKESIVSFGSTDKLETTFTADVDGEYVLRLTVKDQAGNPDYDEVILTKDVVAPAKVTTFYAATGDGFVDLHWTVSDSADFAGVKVYRSLVAEELGELIVTVVKDFDFYSDNTVSNGQLYYYSLKAFDFAGNLSEASILSVTPRAAELVASTSIATPKVSAEKPAGQTVAPKEVKAAASEEKKDQKVDSKKNNLPVIGLIVLFLLAIVGGYLLYLQNPKMITATLKKLKIKK